MSEENQNHEGDKALEIVAMIIDKFYLPHPIIPERPTEGVLYLSTAEIYQSIYSVLGGGITYVDLTQLLLTKNFKMNMTNEGSIYWVIYKKPDN